MPIEFLFLADIFLGGGKENPILRFISIQLSHQGSQETNFNEIESLNDGLWRPTFLILPFTELAPFTLSFGTIRRAGISTK